MHPRRYLTVAIWVACCIGCSNSPSSPARSSARIDRLFIYARNWPTEEVELALIREGGQSTVTLFRPARDGRPRFVLDSIGPSPNDAEDVRAMLESFDVWTLNAPNAPGAACRTVNGQRSCFPTFNDYSVVMRVESGGEVRVQRYTRLETTAGNREARGLGDFVLAWARKRDLGGQGNRQP
jgi:hypothetical protein